MQSIEPLIRRRPVTLLKHSEGNREAEKGRDQLGEHVGRKQRETKLENEDQQFHTCSVVQCYNVAEHNIKHLLFTKKQTNKQVMSIFFGLSRFTVTTATTVAPHTLLKEIFLKITKAHQQLSPPPLVQIRSIFLGL